MQAIYIVILTFSAAFAAASFMRLQQRLSPLFHLQHAPVGALIMLPAIGFLMVVSAPPPVLVAAFLLTLLGWWSDRRAFTPAAVVASMLVAATLGLMGLPLPDITPLHLPLPLFLFACWIVWWMLSLTNTYLPPRLIDTSLVAIIAMTPLALAPLFTAAPFTLSLDIAIVGSALLGALYVAQRRDLSALSLRWPLAFFFAYALLRAASAGAWHCVLASVVVWCAALFWQHSHTEAA